MLEGCETGAVAHDILFRTRKKQQSFEPLPALDKTIKSIECGPMKDCILTQFMTRRVRKLQGSSAAHGLRLYTVSCSLLMPCSFGV